MATWFSGGKRHGREVTSLGRGSPAPDVKGRLSFSSLETPRPTTQMHRLSSDRPGPSGGSRLGEYHRSKQSPAVLDRFFSPPTTLSHPSHTLYKSSPTVNINSERFNVFSPRSEGPAVPLSPSRRARTPLQSSLLPRRLSDQRASSFGPSLVNLAVRGRLRQSHSAAVSPVIVQLSSPSTPSGSGGTSELSQRTLGQGENQPDPCNKEVVISALKQKRKRWACPTDDTTTTVESQPAAKKPRHTNTNQQHSHTLPSTPVFARPSLHSRKRDHTSSVSSSLSHQALKKPRVLHPPPSAPPESSTSKMDTTSRGVAWQETEKYSERKTEGEFSSRDMQEVTMPETGQPREHVVSGPGVSGAPPVISRSLKLSVPEVDYESDSESVRCLPAVCGKVDGVEESSVDSGRGSRGSTPPVQEEEEEDGREEEDRARKSKADLHRLHKSLTAIFPSLHKSTSRRKVPVFCATGSAPLQPPVLSSSRSVTQEDWRKERELARARLRDFLAAEDDPPSTLALPSTATTSLSTGSPSTQQGTPTTETPPLAVSTTLPVSTTSLTSSDTSLATSVTSVTSSVTSSTTFKLNTSQPAIKSVTFQLPNVATSTQSASSVAAATSQSDPVQSGSGTGMGPVFGMGIKGLPSMTAASTVAISQFSTTITSSLSLPLTTSSSTTTGRSLTGGGVSLPTSGLKLPLPSTTPTATPPQLPTSQPQQDAKPSLQHPPTLFPINHSLNSALQTVTNTTSVTSNTPQPATVTASIMSSPLLLQPGLSSLVQPAPNPAPVPAQQSLTANNQPMMFAPLGSRAQLQLTNTSTTARGATTGGFSFSGGLKFPSLTTTTSTSSSTASGLVAPPLTTPISQGSSVLQQSLMAAPLQKLPTGGLFKLEQTPKSTQSVPSTTTSGGLTFNFGGNNSGFKFSSSGPTPQLQQVSQQKSQSLFGGGPQQTGGISLGGSGGIFGTSTTTTSVPAFNFSASITSSAPQPLKPSGGIFSNSGPQTNNSSKPPSFNFGSLSNPSMAFNFSAVPQQQQSQQAAANTLQFSGGVGGAVGGATSGKFNFSGLPSEPGSSVGLSGGSSTGFQFGAAPTSQGGNVGFKFSTGSNSTGGLNFGTNMTPSGQMGGAMGNTVFGGSTNQMQVGGVFGQSTPQQSSSSTSGLFNPSLTAPLNPSLTAPATSLTPQSKPQLGGFNFTPQPTANTFNFSAGPGAGFGTPSGVFGTPGVGSGLFSAGTPSETSRPVATARRRRGRRK